MDRTHVTLTTWLGDGARGHRQGARLPRAKEGRALLERETEGIKAERLMLLGDLVGSASQPLD